MSSVTATDSESALKYFGGEEAVYRRLATAISTARNKREMDLATLARTTNLPASRIESFENREEEGKNFKVHQVIGLLALFGIMIERVLSYRTTLTKSQRKYWIASMAEKGGFVVASGGRNARVDPAIALDIFIRVQAVEELLSSGGRPRA